LAENFRRVWQVALLEYVLADGSLRDTEPLDWRIAALENVAKSLRA
jgi:hypothetical protein